MRPRLILLAVALATTSSLAFAQSGAPKAQKTDVKAKVVDINSATAAELAALPAIGDAIAKKIIAGRPWRAKNELVDKGVMPQSAYDKVKDQIVARQGSKK